MSHVRTQQALALSLILASSSGCSDNQSSSSKIGSSIYKPGISTTWQWQLQGEPNLSYDADLYDLDLFNTSTEVITSLHQRGKKVICYFSAGSYESFRSDANTFPNTTLGETLSGFEDEKWLDIRSDAVINIMKARLDLAKSKNCDGVEPDNMDGYANNSGFDLTAKDQISFNRTIANEAHARGLSVGLKNNLEQLEELVSYYDFSVNEQCHEYDECDRLSVFIDAGKPVFNAEYKADYITDQNTQKTICEKSQQLGIQTLLLPLDLDDSFRIECKI